RWAEAAELSERAAAAAGSELEGLRPAELLYEAGTIYAQHLGDEARAVAAFRRALDADPASRRPLTALAGVYRDHGRRPELLEVLQRLAAHETEPPARLSLQLEIAEVADAAGSVEAAIG